VNRIFLFYFLFVLSNLFSQKIDYIYMTGHSNTYWKKGKPEVLFILLEKDSLCAQKFYGDTVFKDNVCNGKRFPKKYKKLILKEFSRINFNEMENLTKTHNFNDGVSYSLTFGGKNYSLELEVDNPDFETKRRKISEILKIINMINKLTE